MFNENFNVEKMLEMQKQQLEPIMKWNAFALQAFEKVARKNHEVAGDCLDYMVSQGQIGSAQKSGPEVFAACIDGSRAFGEKMAQRSAEYIELSKELNAEAPTQVVAS